MRTCLKRLQKQTGICPSFLPSPLTWYSRSCLAMSCLALCSASSRSLVRALASFTASSPRSSASASWFSRLPRWRSTGTKNSSMLDWNHPESYILRVWTLFCVRTCALTASISLCSRLISRLTSATSPFTRRSSSPYWLACTDIWSNYRQRKVNINCITVLCLWTAQNKEILCNLQL